MNVSDIQQYIHDHPDFKITDVSRMRYSSGVMNLVDIDNDFRLRVDNLWTGYWTKKYKELTITEFNKWLRPKLIKAIEEHEPNTPYFLGSCVWAVDPFPKV